MPSSLGMKPTVKRFSAFPWQPRASAPRKTTPTRRLMEGLRRGTRVEGRGTQPRIAKAGGIGPGVPLAAWHPVFPVEHLLGRGLLCVGWGGAAAFRQRDEPRDEAERRVSPPEW